MAFGWDRERRKRIYTEDAEGREGTKEKKKQDGHGMPCPYERWKMHGAIGSGAEEDGFALEHFYGDEEGESGVDAVGSED